jgi:tetratricopeptide (TPR) repeat protein
VSRITLTLMVAAALAAGCSRGPAPKPMDEPMRIARDSAMAELGHGNYAGAMKEFERALARAYVRDDGRAAAAYRYQIGACLSALGRLDDARAAFAASAHEALRPSVNDGVMASRATAAEARLSLEPGKTEQARLLATLALNLNRSASSGKGDSRLSADLHLILAEAEALKGGGQLDEARKELGEARKAWGKVTEDPVFEAVAARVKGRILAQEGKAQEAADAFGLESDQWQKAQRFGERAAALERAAVQTEKVPEKGDVRAADLYLKAARIRYGLGQLEQANILAVQAEKLAKKADRPQIAALARLLQLPSP